MYLFTFTHKRGFYGAEETKIVYSLPNSFGCYNFHNLNERTLGVIVSKHFVLVEFIIYVIKNIEKQNTERNIDRTHYSHN